jgi:hypothetical protein
VGERKDVKRAVVRIRDPVLFELWIREGKKIRIRDEHLRLFSESFETIFWVDDT